MNVNDIPALNATLNALATVLMTIGFVCIKTGRKDGHRRAMISAFAVSAVFLVGYVTHKYLVGGSTPNSAAPVLSRRSTM